MPVELVRRVRRVRIVRVVGVVRVVGIVETVQRVIRILGTMKKDLPPTLLRLGEVACKASRRPTGCWECMRAPGRQASRKGVFYLFKCLLSKDCCPNNIWLVVACGL